MFDIGWTELMVIGVVALIVVGPKDLPGMFRTLGRFTAKAKKMAREFTRAMEDAADESGVGDLAKDLKGMTSAKNLGLDTLKDAATNFEKWDPVKSGSKSKKGPATQAMTEERAEAARKIHDATAKKATERLAAEKAATAKAAKPKPKKPKPKPAKKPAAKAPTSKTAPKATPKPAPAKATRAKPAVKKTPAKKPAKKAAK
ncbi:MAG: twin-arginine translocase subunit TatB [Marinosulfonomonas sp.]|nr:MAG: twin-arginine translocase subunit TatB [Marinosulfonomonas sp.]